MRGRLGNVVPLDDEVPEAIRSRTYQRYPNPIYEMGCRGRAKKELRTWATVGGTKDSRRSEKTAEQS